MDVNPLELVATLMTLACVILGVKRSLWQFPVGILGTGLAFFVVLQAGIYANASLQLFFVCVQFYGWWYWLRGANGARPKIKTTDPVKLAAGAALALVAALALAPPLEAYAGSKLPLLDAAVFCFSVFAQILLDRKRIETWLVWIVVNVMSVGLYYVQGLTLFMTLYVFFFFNAFWGWLEWRKELRGVSSATAQGGA